MDASSESHSIADTSIARDDNKRRTHAGYARQAVSWMSLGPSAGGGLRHLDGEEALEGGLPLGCSQPDVAHGVDLQQRHDKLQAPGQAALLAVRLQAACAAAVPRQALQHHHPQLPGLQGTLTHFTDAITAQAEL